jgi:tetratricopeptide (TPR) repeat protein
MTIQKRELPKLVTHSVLQIQNGSWEQHLMMAEVVRHIEANPEAAVWNAAYFILAVAEELRRKEGGNARSDTTSVYYVQFRITHHADFCIDYCRRVLGKNIATIVPLDCTITFAIWNVRAGKYKLAIGMLKAGLEHHKSQFQDSKDPKEREIFARAQRALANAFRNSNKLEEAYEQQMTAIQVLTDLSRQPGVSRSVVEELIRARGELATIYRERGWRDKNARYFRMAISLQTEVVEQAGAYFGKSSSESLHEMSCLSAILTWAGSLDLSLEKDKEIFDLCNNSYPNNPTLRQRQERLRKMKHLGQSYYHCAEYDEAVRLEKEVLKETRDIRGVKHLETAEALYNLAVSYHGKGIQEQRRNKHKPWTSDTLVNIDLDSAMDCIREALDIRQEFLGKEHEQTKKAIEQQEKILQTYVLKRG